MRPVSDAGPGAPALALSLLALMAAVLAPPELSVAGRSSLGLFAAAAALLFAWRQPWASSGAGWAALGLVPLAACSVLAALCRARALDEAALFGTLVLVGLLGFASSRDGRSWRLVPVVLAGLGTGVALQAVVQAEWLYPRQASALRAGGSPVEDNLILRLEAGRPSGPFILPSSLAGFLALALPGTLLLARRAASRWSRAFLAAAAVLELYALVRTRSLGGLVAASCGLLLALPALSPRRRLVSGVVMGILAIALGGWFLHVRRAEFGQGPGGDPLRLRSGNWQAAVQMIRDRPLLGVGPGSFGTAYPRYLREGMNETQYAHNSYLQAAACWGLWILGPIGFLLFAWMRRVGALVTAGAVPGREADTRLALSAGAATFLVHNLVDFTLYLPGIAVPAALLLGMSFGDGGQSPKPAYGWRPGACLVALAAAGLLGWHAHLAGWSDARMEVARGAAEAGRLEQAASAARQAAEARPGSPEPWAFLAQLVLAHHMEDAALRREGVQAATRAVRLDPDSAILHHTRALYHAAAGERAPAYLEERRAHELYPLKREYQPPAAEGTP